MLSTFLLGLSFAFMAPLPPDEYQQNGVSADILFLMPSVIDPACGGQPNDGMTILACSEVGGTHMLAPHPCLYPDDPYARLLCHELGHISGWPANHPTNLPVGKTSPQTSQSK